MKKYQIFNLIGSIGFIAGFILTCCLIWTCSQEQVNMIQETLFGIGSVSMFCGALIMLIISYKMKEGL